MAAVPYTPTVFSKGARSETATTWSQHWAYIFDGWVAGPPVATVTVTPPSYALKTDAEDLVASSRDNSTTASVLPVGSYGLLPPRIVVPPTTRPVILSFGASFYCTASGTGMFGVGVADISDGTTRQQTFKMRQGAWVSTGTYLPLLGDVDGQYELDPSTNWRYYRLIGAVFRDSGSLAVSVLPGGTGGPSYQPADRAAYLRAVMV